jgi:hypothetical protein
MTKETVRKIEWKPKWSGGAPMPQVFSNGQKIYLVYTIADWDKKSIDKFENLPHDGRHERFLALVEFNGNTFRFGIANDEVFQGLRYYNQGIEGGQIIENSRWIEEIKQIHKIHPYFNEARWTDLNHYLLLFKDEILEVIATDYRIDIYKTTYDRLGKEIIERMNKSQ